MGVEGVPRAALADRRLEKLHDLVQGWGFRVEGSGFRVQGPGFRVQASGFRVWDCGFEV